MKLSIPYGQALTDVDLPRGIRLDTLEPQDATPLADPVTAIREALRHPIGAAPLRDTVRPGERVCILVNDITRLVRTDLFLPVLVDELNQSGIPDAQIFAVFALGNHRPQTPAEQRQIVGEDLARRIALFNHDCRRLEDLVLIGRTSRGNEARVSRRVRAADRVILTGEITYHPIAGYSGGRKSLFPGVAGEEFIRFNHRLILDPRCENGVLEGNPAHEDLLEACRMFGPDFLLNAILNSSGQILHVVAGHYEFAHRAGCELVDRTYAVPLQGPYDVVMASAGGFPFDIDLRQAHKGMAHAVRALRDGGTLIYFAECGEGSGSRALEEWAGRFTSAAEMKQALGADFVVGGHKAYWLAQLGERYQVFLVSSLSADFVRKCHLRPAADAQEILQSVCGTEGPESRIAYIPHASFAMPVVQTAASGVRQGPAWREAGKNKEPYLQ